MPVHLSSDDSSRPVTRLAQEKTRPLSADVARRAGVSRATVSYVLNNTPGQKISPQTREAVLRAAAELGYRPNLAAKTLAGGNGLVLFVLTGAAQNDLTTAIASSLTVALARVGVMVAVHFDANHQEILLEVIRDLQPRAVVFSTPPEPEVAQFLADSHILAIGATSSVSEAAQSAANSDNAGIPGTPGSPGALQVAHLLARGHRRIAYADMASAETFLSRQRRRDVAAACAAAGLPMPLTAAISTDGQGAQATVMAWWEQQVTAICAYNDEVALAALYGIREAGLRCPDDIAVIGIDGIAAGAVAYPPLTTVAILTRPAAEWYAQSLLYQLRLAPPPSPPHDILTLIERAST